MHAHYPLFPKRRTQRGQTLIVAIAILFVLIFIGGIFVAQVGRNLTTSGRSRQIQQATELATGGINYCDEQLNSSEEGADWRPDPAVLLTSPGDLQGLRDPDYVWIIKGFHRILTKNGRTLVRVVYDPNPADPRGHYLKIESIGRPGELNPEDPTDFVPAGTSSRLRKEMIAYKQIGLTDYLRFVTQRTKNSTEAVFGGGQFGVPIALVMGEPEIGNDPNANQRAVSGVFNNNSLLFGAPIHVNGNLRIVGETLIYLSKRGQVGDSATERIQATESIIVEPTNGVPTSQAFVNSPINVIPNVANAIVSTGTNFTTLAGRVRDGSPASDAAGFSRGTITVNPPVLSNPIAGGSEGRYPWMTANSGVLGGTAANPYNTGRGGYGTRIYINNPQDRQEESSEIGNALSLRAEWLRSKDDALGNGHWQGPFYQPPGITVELFGNRIRLTRNDGNVFTLPDGTPLTQQGGNVLDIPLSDFERRNYVLPNGTPFPLEPFPHDGDESESNPNNPTGYAQQFLDKNSYGVNVVLYAEGNVRSKGPFGAITNTNEISESATVSKLGRVHLTIVSGGTAYIEGNLVKGDGSINNGILTQERGSTCAVMARDYICVNTTAFMSPANQSQAWNTLTVGTNFFRTEVGTTALSADMTSSFGIDPANYDTPTYLFLRHTAGDILNPSLMNLLINPAFAQNPEAPFYRFNDPGLGAFFAHVRALGVKYNNGAFFSDTTSNMPEFEQRAYPLFSGTLPAAYQLSRLPGLVNLFRFRLDETSRAGLAGSFANIGTGAISNYLLGGAFVAPLDIRIEAMLYAQDRSFFIIPGYPVNPEPNDIAINAGQNGERKVVAGDTPQDIELKKYYPFYNQPADIRITIEGAISENYTASLADQTQWMSRWGWIPGNFGSSTQKIPNIHLTVRDPLTINPAQNVTFDYRTPQEASANVARGLRYLYDPILAMPYTTPRAVALVGDARAVREQRQIRALRAKTVRVGITDPLNPNSGTPVRQILPPTPRLPVCPDLLFMGDSDRRLEQD